MNRYKMKTTLIFAGITECGFDSFGKTMEGSWISHGLCHLSACAKEKGFDINLIDLRKLKGWEHFREKIKEEKPDVVGLSMMSVDYDYVVKCARIIKEEMPDTKIIVGGPHPTILLDEVKEIKEFDHIIMKEAEISFVELLERIKNREESERIITGKMPDLNKLPFADRELFGQHEIPISDFLPEPFVTLIAGRGCIYNCSFCQPAERKIFGNKVRRRSVDNVISELKFLRNKYNFKSMMIHDDCLTEDKEWVKEFCRKYKEEGFIQPFVCQSRADIICKHEDMVKELKDAGLVTFLIGFESGNQRILNFLRKGTKTEHNFRAAEICHKLGIKIWANYMLGIPTETKEEAMDTIDMIKEIKPYHCSPAFFTPHPGSDLYDYCVKNDLMIMQKHSSYRRNINIEEPKIKGIDYVYLQKITYESLDYSEEAENRIKFTKKIKPLYIILGKRLFRLMLKAKDILLKEGFKSFLFKTKEYIFTRI